MARSATTSDAFNAIAEGRRRAILDLLCLGELSVNDVVETLDLSQPQVSKHLRVLREVGLVTVRDSGRRRLYSVQAIGLKHVHDWVKQYERFWEHKLQRIKARAERKAAKQSTPSNQLQRRKDHHHDDGNT